MNEIENLLNSLKEYKIESKNVIEEKINNTVNLTEEFLLENIKTYKDVCHYLNEPLETLPYFQIKQIEKLFNGNWIKDFSKDQKNWYPYFVYNKVSGCLGFYYSICSTSTSGGQVAFYKSKEISDFVGKIFIDIYNKL